MEKMRLYLKFFGIHLRSHMQHKTSFFLSIAGQIAMSCTSLLGIYFMFLRFPTVGGFTFAHILLCFATVLMAFSLAECLGRGFDSFPTMLGNGEFDRVLVRPRGEIFLVLASRVELTRIGRLLQAAAVLFYAIPKSQVIWTFDKIITLVLMVICGAIVFFALFLVYASIAFFTTEGLEFMNIFTDGGREFGRYPFSIYGDGVLKFLTYVIPLALFQYYPLLYITGIEKSRFYMLMPVLSLLFVIPCYFFWRFGLHRFKSTGS